MRTDANLKELCNQLQINCGDLHKACRAVGLSPGFVFTWMRDDAEASKQVDEAQRVGYLGLESEAIRRAVHGIEEGVYYKGELVGAETKYSDTLLGKLLEANVSKYKKGEQSGSTFNGPTQINIMPRAENYEQWLAMKDATISRREQEKLPAPSSVPDILQGEYVEIPHKGFAVLEGLL